jgi:20S proteasome alpha/beta subunit
MQDIRNISLPTSRRLKRMTTVIGIKCTEGIVIASDSQATSEAIKDLQTSKIFPINNSMCVGAAGNIGHIRILTEELKKGLDGYVFDTESQLTSQLDDMVVNLHRIYNVQRSARLGYSTPAIIFNANGILAA